MKILQPEKGFIISLVTFFVMTIAVVVILVMGSLMSYNQKISTNSVKSTQSYYAAESGAEDALLRLKNNPNMSSLSYNVTVGGAVSAVTIPNFIGSARTVTVQANNNSIIKNINVVYSLDSTGTGFHYAVQAGGGFSLGSGSEVVGNIFANGDISNPNSAATIDNSVVLAGSHQIIGHNNGNKISVGGNIQAYGCSNATITGTVTYVTGGTPQTCSGSGSSSFVAVIANQDMPITQSQIDAWKSSASTACNSADVTSLAGNNNSVSLGPCKVTGDLTVGIGSTLTMNGNIYVTGNMVFSNKSNLILSSSFGASSGIIVADGTFTVSNNVTVKSLGQTGSGIILLSTNSSSSAINIQNGGTIDGATLYASAGGISLNNNAHLHQITAAGTITLGNNIKLQYDVGLAQSSFTSGPGGTWKVTSWQEK